MPTGPSSIYSQKDPESMVIKEIEPAGGWYAHYRKKEARARLIKNVIDECATVAGILVVVAAFAVVGTLEHL